MKRVTFILPLAALALLALPAVANAGGNYDQPKKVCQKKPPPPPPPPVEEVPPPPPPVVEIPTPPPPVVPVVHPPKKPKRPLLVVKKSGPAVLRPGRRAMYVVRVTNFGNATADRVFIRDTLPPGLVFASTFRGYATIHALRPGRSRVLRIPVSVLMGADGRICNKVQAIVPGRTVSSTKCSRVASPPTGVLDSSSIAVAG